MTYRISQTDPAAMTTEEMTSEIEGFVQLAEEVVARLSVILRELRKRHQPHPFFQHSVLRFFESIADQTLHPKAALILANRDMIKAVLPLPRAEQMEIAYGKEVATATATNTGDIANENMIIQRMDLPTIKRVFGPEGIRSIAEQEQIIRAAGKVERHGNATIYPDKGTMKYSGEFSPEDVRQHFAALGYTIQITRNVPARPDARSVAA